MSRPIGKRVVTAKGSSNSLETPLPLEHNRSLAGSLKPFIKRAAPTNEALRDAREAARAAAATERVGGLTDTSGTTEQ